MTSARVFESSYGGEGKFSILLAEWLSRQDFRVTVIGSTFMNVRAANATSFKDIQNKQNSNKNINIKKVSPPYFIYSTSRLIMSFLWILKLISINRSFKVDLIHAQDTGYAGLAAVIAGRILKLPVVITSHGIRHITISSQLKGRLKGIFVWSEKKLDIFTCKHADLVTAVSINVKQYLENLSHREIDMIPLPIDIAKFDYSDTNRFDVRKEFGIEPSREVVIGFVGRLVPVKNPFVLLSSFSQLIRAHRSAVLLIVGTGPLESKMKEFCSEKMIEKNVIFCGARNDVGRILSAIDIFILPSTVEGMPTVILEAMACRRAIIASDIPANNKIIENGKEGLLFAPQDISSLTESIEILIKNSSLRNSLGMNAMLKVKDFDISKVLPKMLRCYHQLL